MIALDTHAWIWLASNSTKLSRKAKSACSSAEALLVSAISVWEVAMLVAKARLVLDRDVEVWIRQALALPKVRLEPLTPTIAVRATRLATAFPGDPADRIIAATALEHAAPLVTRDERLRAQSTLRTIW
jgi:PIN domain nuclease of toxin-antitoxin system